MPARYAIYYAPEQDSPLDAFARSWLGRDALTGREHPVSECRHLTAEALHQATESPRHYGFHATLKPPFVLAQGRTASELCRAAAAFAGQTPPVALSLLRLKWIGGFLAIVPEDEPQGLRDLASQCVSRFDGFRAPPSREETRKRLAAGLTQRQRQLLAKWGYPYVMEEFRLHLTLSGKLRDSELKDKVKKEAAERLGNILVDGLAVDSICIFSQPEMEQPFRLVRRFALSGG